jgi:hypothetical protein
MIAVVLPDGMTVLFEVRTLNYVWTLVDLNGSKPPNVVGKDLFRFYFHINGSDQGFGPGNKEMDYDDVLNNTTSGCNKNATGILCARLILLDGWEIRDDYPW